MAQHDYVIDNSTGANVRADINNALLAISSTNSGSSAPSTTYAFQLFANTTTSKLQIRNAGNSAFVDLIGLDGSILLPDGSVSSPSLAFSDDLNTGIFSSAADTFNVATAGVERMELGATTIFNEDGADVDFRIEGDTEANLFYVDAGNDRVGVRTNTPSDFFEVTHADNSAAGISITNTNNSQASAMAQLLIAGGDNSKGRLKIETNGAFHTIDEDNNGNLIIEDNGTERLRIHSGAQVQINGSSLSSISSFADDLVLGQSGSTAINGMTFCSTNSTSIRFHDTADAGEIEFAHSDNSLTVSMTGLLKIRTNDAERMRIDSSGNVGIGTSSPDAAIDIIRSENTTYDSSQASHQRDVGSTLCIRNNSTTTNSFAQLLFRNQASNTGGCRIVSINKGNNASDLAITTGDTNEAMRIDSSGNVNINSTGDLDAFRLAGAGSNVRGHLLRADGIQASTTSGQQLASLNRLDSDGNLINFIQNGSLEGNISVSGSTVSYNGGHLSRWSQIKGLSKTDKSARPEIYQGTVMSNLDDLCEWEGEENQQLNMTKVSDVDGDKNVAGVFWTWDDDDDEIVNDFYIAMTGDMVIRVAASTTVARGDLLISAGDGTAKPQADDIIRSSTIAKIISTNHTATYADGSKAYPCVLMAC